jgi:hypothetical protein
MVVTRGEQEMMWAHVVQSVRILRVTVMPTLMLSTVKLPAVCLQ